MLLISSFPEHLTMIQSQQPQNERDATTRHYNSRCCGLTDEDTATGGAGTRNTPTHGHVRQSND